MENTKTVQKEARKLVFQVGCAGALKTTLNRSYGTSMLTEELATAPLCGGIMQEGHQCGMLWGAALAAGAQAFGKSTSTDEAIVKSINAAKELNTSFVKTAKHVNCREITRCNQRSILGMVKYILTGKPLNCAKLSGRWAPEAIEAANAGLEKTEKTTGEQFTSCSYLLAKKMKASEKEAVMVSGFAGGIGLSGNTCGALGAGVYLKALDWQRNKPGDTTFKIPESKKVLEAFLTETGGETQCNQICGRIFETPEEHSVFMKKGRCDKIINALAKV